jgi:hypothetical protein
MPRRNAFQEWAQQKPEAVFGSEDAIPAPPTPIDLMGAIPKRRNRQWDNQHRAWSYKIPNHLRKNALNVRDAITGIAQSGSATTDEIAIALISLALSHVDRGILKIQGRPDPLRQKMSVIWEESEGKWPQEIPLKRVQPKKKEEVKKSLYIAYRWPASVHQQICSLAGDAFSRGEIVVALLQHSLDSYRLGSLRLKFQPKTTVSGEWS